MEGPCRGCLQARAPAEPPFSPLAARPHLAALYAALLGRQTIEDDGLPENICDTCLEKITYVYEFKLQCEKSEAVFKKYVNDIYSQIGDMYSKNDMSKNDTILIVLPESEIMHQNIENSSDNDKNDIGDLFGILLNNHNENEMNPSSNAITSDVNWIKTEDISDDSKRTLDIKKQNYECTMCHKRFISKGELKLHMRTHPLGTKHVCKICSCSYRKANNLKRHYLTHTSQRKFICKQCGRGFFHSNALKAHMIYHEEKKYNCLECDEKFYHRHLLSAHLKTQHLIGDTANDQANLNPQMHKENLPLLKKHDCTMCNETYSNSEDLKEHKKTHPRGTKHFCKLCGKSYAEFSTLKRHLTIHTGKKSYLCTVCGKEFYFKNVLRSHMIYHNEKNHKCDLCDKKFHTRSMLLEHIRMNHTDEKYNFMCELCGKLCSSVHRLKLHKTTHSKMTCPFCGKIYRNIRYYKEHLNSHDENGVPKKTFICDYCGEHRNLKTLLELHILSKHLKERRYMCKVCNKGYFSKGSLNEHEIVHSRANMVKCTVCDRLLVNKKALILHIRLHTGEKPYVCNICGERFLSSSRRLAHQKSKHGERTEYCPMCPSKFFLRSDLNKHMFLHSKDAKKPKKELI